MMSTLGLKHGSNLLVDYDPDWTAAFEKGRERTERTHLVHVVEFEGPSWRSNLAFRDALRASESLRLEYLRVKEHAATSAPVGRAQYNELKNLFIDRWLDRFARSSLTAGSAAARARSDESR